jgi:ferredoxin-NADP reductase
MRVRTTRTVAFKRAFAALQPGDTVVVQGPLGHDLLDAARPAVLVAGGIGITPLKGMAEYAVDRKLSIPVRLVYSSRTVEEIVYREELEALERSNPGFHVLHTLTSPWVRLLDRQDGARRSRPARRGRRRT